jgi:tetratricopeptide (TPR) repeat protein
MVFKSAGLKHASTLFICLLCMHACTTTHQSRQTRTAADKQLPRAVELTETPFHAQTRHHCGPAALATVLQSQGLDVTTETLSSQLYIPQRKGSLQVEMAVAARRHGMLPYPLEPSLADLLTEIAAGNPVLVLQNLGFNWWPKWHYAVVIGYDLDGNELILRSGTTRRWQTSFTAFENTWKRAGQWALVIVPAGVIPPSAHMSTYLKSAYAFEETGLYPAALDAYRAASAQWPDSSTAWTALGNMELRAGNNVEALAALLNASSLSPRTAMIWNNLAYALHATGCTEQALQSLQCAYRLSSDDSNIRDSEEEIRRMVVKRQTTACPVISCD